MELLLKEDCAVQCVRRTLVKHSIRQIAKVWQIILSARKIQPALLWCAFKKSLKCYKIPQYILPRIEQSLGNLILIWIVLLFVSLHFNLAICHNK